MIKRRQLLAGLPAGIGMGLLGHISARAEAVRPHLYSSVMDSHGANFLARNDGKADSALLTNLPDRGHGIAVRQDGRLAVVCARRPGRFAVAFDPKTGEAKARFDSPDNRHFYGHADFMAGGRLLVTTENDYDGARGILGIHDAQDNFRRIAEWESGGIGPHEVIASPDHRYLLAANGGLLTHPDTGRAKLNIDTMQPSVTIIDTTDGKIETTLILEDPALRWMSLRHVAVNNKGQVAVAGQWEGEEFTHPPLIAVSDDRQKLQTLLAPPEIQQAMANYCGSVAFDRSGKVFCATCPRGNIATFWLAEAPARYLTSVRLDDVCGVVASRRLGSFYLSTGMGELVEADGINGTVRTILDGQDPDALRWDNHLVLLES